MQHHHHKLSEPIRNQIIKEQQLAWVGHAPKYFVPRILFGLLRDSLGAKNHYESIFHMKTLSTGESRQLVKKHEAYS